MRLLLNKADIENLIHEKFGNETDIKITEIVIDNVYREDFITITFEEQNEKSSQAALDLKS